MSESIGVQEANRALKEEIRLLEIEIGRWEKVAVQLLPALEENLQLKEALTHLKAVFPRILAQEREANLFRYVDRLTEIAQREATQLK